jgi:periplasmic protein CpxP/Spy
MSNESKNKILISIIAILLLANIGMLIFFEGIKKHGGKDNNDAGKVHSGITDLLKKEVGFSDTQLAQYKTMRKEHWDKMKPLFDEMNNTKTRFYNLLDDPSVNDSLLNNMADSIGIRQKNIDLQIFHHFKEVGNLCTPEQQPKFDSLVVRVIKRMTTPHKPPTKPQEDSLNKTNSH